MSRENKNPWTLRECKILGKGFRIKFTQWWEAKVLIRWNLEYYLVRVYFYVHILLADTWFHFLHFGALLKKRV